MERAAAGNRCPQGENGTPKPIGADMSDTLGTENFKNRNKIRGFRRGK